MECSMQDVSDASRSAPVGRRASGSPAMTQPNKSLSCSRKSFITVPLWSEIAEPFYCSIDHSLNIGHSKVMTRTGKEHVLWNP